MKRYDVKLDLNPNSCASKIIEWVESKSVILEFGCSYGYLAQYLHEMKACQVYGIDIDEEALSVAKEHLENGWCSDIDEFEWREKIADIQFDYIIFADVLEHLKYPQKAIKVATELLKEDGEIIFSIPNIAHADIINKLLYNHFDYTEVGILDNTHLHFWASENIEEFCREAGMRLVEITGVYIPPFYTEQRPEFVSRIQNEIANKKYGAVYQFVCKTVKEDYAGKKRVALVNRIDELKGASGNHIKLYKDFGQGFSEETCELVPIHMLSDVDFKYICEENELSIRIDPCEGSDCILYEVEIYIDGTMYNEYVVNGERIDKYIVFTNKDPFLIIPREALVGHREIYTRYKLLSFEGFDFQNFYKHVKQQIVQSRSLYDEQK